MLICDGLTITQDDFTLRADVTFEAGKLTALIGPSGAGKSTLLSAIGGFLSPASGRVLWDGQDLTNRSPAERPVSFLFQDNNLFPHLSALQNVGLGLRPTSRLTVAERKQAVAALDAVGLGGFDDRKPAALSGGQQSRVALARVMVANRPVVLLDEPFAALGPALKDEMLNLVQQKLLAHKRTVIMVTHDPADAMAVADQTALVAAGEVAQPVKTGDLFAEPPPALAAYLGARRSSRP